MKTEPFHRPHDPIPAAIADKAAAWLARRDRGLSPAEQDEYLQWLGADPRHTEAVTQHAAALERMMQLYEWQPGHDTEPNPDLFAVPRRRTWLWSSALAAAAAIAVILAWQQPWRETRPMMALTPRSYLHVNERLALPDGSRVELKDGTKVVVQYSERERRVKLTGGEAHFTVWKDASRPFIVDAAGVEVRAVGTAFNVRLEEKSVEVLVTEGRVKVAATPEQMAGDLASLPEISQGERATVALPDPAAAMTPAVPVVAPVTAEEISQELAWQAPWLQFYETPLADAVAEFNRLNQQQIVIADPELRKRRIDGTFRPDNVEGFVRLLTTTLDIRAETNADGQTVLRSGP
ncbi:FecR domain-containing protein [Opitutus sp. GAS368]|uniref:FecR family protein n=1 Tax=Opitutus sp. GAS368 TaxID=1882749 RepID=UPI000879919E|nr:FecR domain-containing protein [Opitutus sp. GAS368]SDS05125.1 FecR family protein [Opitutus sp. GAS368]